MLTMNRPDGDFGPQYDHDLTTSFEDIILIPLPCWIFLLIIALFFITNRRHNNPKGSEKDAHRIEQGTRRHLRLLWTTYLFFLFTAGILILSIDEIARLAILGWGVGLLPFLPIATIIATILYLMRYRLGAASRSVTRPQDVEKGIAVRILVFWIMMIVVEAVKLHTLIKLQGPFPRTGSSYPISQQVLDVAVLIGCIVLVFLLMLIELVRPTLTVKSQ